MLHHTWLIPKTLRQSEYETHTTHACTYHCHLGDSLEWREPSSSFPHQARSPRTSPVREASAPNLETMKQFNIKEVSSHVNANARLTFCTETSYVKTEHLTILRMSNDPFFFFIQPRDLLAR